MRILCISMDHGAYSDRSHEVRVAEEFARQGHDVVLVVERSPVWSPRSAQPANLEVRVMPVNDASRAGAIAAALPSDVDAVFASSVSGAPILAAFKVLHPSSPAVVSKRVVAQVLDCPLWRLEFGEQGPWLASWRPWFEGLLAMDSLVVNTTQTEMDLRAAAVLYGRAVGSIPPVSVVYYGIDTDACDAAVPRRVVPEGTEGAPAAWVVGVSRLVPYKGFDLGFAALALIDQGDRPGYIVVGAGEDMERLMHVQSLARVPAAFTGGISDADKFAAVKGADLGLFLAFNPHIPAQFPMECVYAGVPCIVADTPINRERFLDHVVYVNAWDTRAVARAVVLGLDGLSRDLEKPREWIRAERSFRSHAAGVLRVLQGA